MAPPRLDMVLTWKHSGVEELIYASCRGEGRVRFGEVRQPTTRLRRGGLGYLARIRFRSESMGDLNFVVTPAVRVRGPARDRTCGLSSSTHPEHASQQLPRKPVSARVERRARPSPRAPSRAMPPQFPPEPEPGTREALELLYESAKAEENAGRVSNAIRMYESLVQLDPANGRAWVRYAVILHKSGHMDRARDILRRALKVNPRNAILWQTWADFEKGRGNFVNARRLFAKAAEANPHLPSLYHSWGSMEYKVGRVDEARRLYQEGLRVCPTATRLYHSLGVLEDKRGNSREARIILTQGLKIEPDNPYLHHALGVLEYRGGRVSAARECFSRASRVDPRHTLTWLSWAQLEEFEGNRDMARKYYARGTSVSGRSAVQLWQAWARMEEKSGNPHKAIDLYRKAVSAYPNDPMLYCSWGKLVESQGDIAVARALFKKGLEVDEERAYLWQSLALLEQRQMDKGTAREFFERGVKLSKGKEVAALLHAWAAMEWESENEEKARNLFNEAVKVNDSCSWLWLWFGRFEIAYGKYSAARHYISRSINLDPSDGSPWRAWAELERSEGEEERARFMFRRAAELESSRELFELDPESPLRRPWRKF